MSRVVLLDAAPLGLATNPRPSARNLECAQNLQKANFMNAIRIRQKLESETLHVPQLKPFIGKTVEITIVEDETDVLPPVIPGTGDWNAAARAAEELRRSDYDFDAWRTQRECDLKHANDHLP